MFDRLIILWTVFSWQVDPSRECLPRFIGSGHRAQGTGRRTACGARRAACGN